MVKAFIIIQSLTADVTQAQTVQKLQIPLSHDRQCVPQLKVLFSSGSTSQAVAFHPTCSQYRWCYSWLCVFGGMPLSFNYCSRFVCDLVSQLRIVQYLNSPYDALFHQNMTKSQPYVHCEPYLWLLSKKCICTSVESSVHIHSF